MTIGHPNVILAAAAFVPLILQRYKDARRRNELPRTFGMRFSTGNVRPGAPPDGTSRGSEEARPGMPGGLPDATRQSESIDQFRSTLELLPFAILTSNKHGAITSANAGAQKLFGYSQEELLGAFVNMLIPDFQGGLGAPQQPARFVSPVRAVGGARDLAARRKDGTQFPAEITTNPVSADGEALTLMVVIDRTERYELHRHRQELAHLTRVSTLGELAGSLAHELNQPLTAMLSNVQAAQRFMVAHPVNLAEVREILVDLVQDNRRASEVIRRIRALVKKGELEETPLSLAGVVGDVVLLLHSDAIVRGIRVFVNIDSALPPVSGDKVQLQQVVLNLLLNAFDAMEGNCAHDREVILDATLDSTESVCVAVRDRGPGLEDDILDKLFMPFFTSKRDGLGLGLSISRSIVEMHGGRIWAEGNPEGGAAFFFTLPTASAATTHSVRQP